MPSLVNIGLLFPSAILPHFVLNLFVCLSICAYFFQLLVSNTCENISNRVALPHDLHGLSSILCDAVTIFVYTDLFFCCCAFIYSNFHGKSVTFLHGGLLHCFYYYLSHMKQ